MNIMKFDRNNIRIEKIELLYILAFFVHILWCYFVANYGQISMLNNVTEWLTNIYGNIGFHWSGKMSYIISSGILSALITNAIRRALEGTILGWPRFRSHDINTLIRSWGRVILYVSFVFFGLGALGQNNSIFLEKYPTSLNSTGVLLISIETFLLGAIANPLDDAISATIFYLKLER
jgi:hypothetical protein